jgi:transposase
MPTGRDVRNIPLPPALASVPRPAPLRQRSLGRIARAAAGEVRAHAAEFSPLRPGELLPPLLRKTALPDVATGQAMAERIDRNNSLTFIAFLTLLDQMTDPGLDIYLIMDNGSSHTSRATRAWLTAHPRFKVSYTPKHASWLNIVGMWFSVLTRRLLRRVHHPLQRHRPSLLLAVRRPRRTRAFTCPAATANALSTRPPEGH